MFYQNRDTGKKVLVFKNINVSYSGIMQLREFLNQINLNLRISRGGDLDKNNHFVIEIEIEKCLIKCWDGGVLIVHSDKIIECATKKKLESEYRKCSYFRATNASK